MSRKQFKWALFAKVGAFLKQEGLVNIRAKRAKFMPNRAKLGYWVTLSGAPASVVVEMTRMETTGLYEVSTCKAYWGHRNFVSPR